MRRTWDISPAQTGWPVGSWVVGSPALRSASRASVESIPEARRRSTAVDLTWPTSMLVLRSLRSDSTAVAPPAASRANLRVSTGCSGSSMYAVRVSTARARSRMVSESTSGAGSPSRTVAATARASTLTLRTARSNWSAAVA
jgi:hypothetical protein